MVVQTSYILENDKAFQDAIDKLAMATSDFRIPFNFIANDFYKGNRKIFSLKSAGKYPKLGGFSPNKIRDGQTKTNRKLAEASKMREAGFIYPLLARTGTLASSLLNKSDGFAVNEIKQNSMILGTDVPHAIYHQSDKSRTKIPQRKPVFIDGGPTETSKGANVSGRREAWTSIIFNYIERLVEEV